MNVGDRLAVIAHDGRKAEEDTMSEASERDDQAAGRRTMPRPSAAATTRFRELVPVDPAVSVRPMFGNLAAFANGYLFAGLFGEALYVRLDDSGQASVLDGGGSPFEPMPGRAMRGYVVLPEAWIRDGAKGRAWIEQSLAHTLALPPKAVKTRSRKRAG